MSSELRDGEVGRFGRWADSCDASALQRLVFAPLHKLTLA